MLVTPDKCMKVTIRKNAFIQQIRLLRPAMQTLRFFKSFIIKHDTPELVGPVQERKLAWQYQCGNMLNFSDHCLPPEVRVMKYMPPGRLLTSQR